MFGRILAVALDLLDRCEYSLVILILFLDTGTLQASTATVEGIDEQIRKFTVPDQILVM